jgi:hypothetical protein
MKTAWKFLIGLLLIFTVSGCCGLCDRGLDTCWMTAPSAAAAVAATPTPPQVTMQ